MLLPKMVLVTKATLSSIKDYQVKVRCKGIVSVY